MSSRDYLRHQTTPTLAPTVSSLGDEWYEPISNTLYKRLAVNGTSVSYQPIAVGNVTTTATANTIVSRDSGGNITAVNFLGTASSAKYADLAENYISDNEYKPGTVVVFGGTKEITVTTKSHDTTVAGIISTKPAYLMNSDATGLPVALTGRVPCMVKGPVSKGTVLVTSDIAGVAMAIDNSRFVPGCVIGKALENIISNTVETIEVVVGRH